MTSGRALARWLALALCGPLAAVAQEDWLDQGGVARWAKGSYSYRAIETGAENGSEDFLLVVADDGTRTLRATNAFIDGMEVWRQVVYRVDRDFRPLDLYMNYHTGGAWRGTGFFVVSGNTMRATIRAPGGMTETAIEVPRHFSLIPHPISSDSWPAWYYDRAKGGAQPVTLYSFDGLARDADSLLGGMQRQTLTRLGVEKIRVPAGEFDCEIFVFSDGDPVLYLFGPDQLIARMVWQVANVEYLLTRLETSPPPQKEQQ